MAESAVQDVSLCTGSDSAEQEESLCTGSDSFATEESLSTGQDAVFDITCEPCRARGYHYEAERFCRDCREHLCGDCVRDHKTLLSLWRHKLLDIKNTRASHVTDINVRSTSNTDMCWITGMAVVSNDKLVAADENNGTIKLLDTTNNTIVSEYKLRSKPWDVTIFKDTVAVTLPWASTIVLLKYIRRFVIDREISVNGDCWGIDWYDDKLYVIYDIAKKLEVMTPAGVVLQTFSTTAQGQRLFQDPAYVTVSAVNQRIYVSEFSLARVVVLDLEGNQTGAYNDDELGRPRQLAVDGDGVMFLCDSMWNPVHLLSPAGEKVKILLTRQDGVVDPYSVCYCENIGRLFVAMKKCNTIKVFKLS